MGTERGIFRWFVALVALWLGMALWVHHRNVGEPATSHVTHSSHRFWNGEVTSHFLNALGRYSSVPFAMHGFAVTAPCTAPPEKPCTEASNADVPGSAVVTSHRIGGKVVYTSFPPGAMLIAAPFVLPVSAWLEVESLVVLRWFDLLLALVTVLFMAAALNRLVAVTLPYRGALVALSCLPLLFSVEVLHSHYVSMWSHQVLQPWLAGMLYLSTGSMHARRAAGLGVLAALGCWIEWAAFLVCIALFAVVALRSAPGARCRNAFLFGAIALCGGLSLLLYYEWLVGLGAYLTSLGERMTARSFVAENRGAVDWLRSLVQSFLPWQLATVALLVVYMRTRRVYAAQTLPATNVTQAGHSSEQTRWLAAFLVVALPLLENVLLAEHAVTYTFDRLKWAPFFAVLMAYLGAGIAERKGVRGVLLLGALATLAAVASVLHYSLLYPRYW